MMLDMHHLRNVISRAISVNKIIATLSYQEKLNQYKTCKVNS